MTTFQCLASLILVRVAPVLCLNLPSQHVEGPPPPFEGHVRSRLEKKVTPSNGINEAESVPSNSLEEDEGIISAYPPIESEAGFVTHCQDWFLPKLSQSFISQLDYSALLASTCDILDDEDLPYFDCPDPAFDALGDDVQLLFVQHLCEEEAIGDQLRCLDTLKSSLGYFGYDTSKKSKQWTSAVVLELCCGLLQFIQRARLDPLAGPECEAVDMDAFPSTRPSPVDIHDPTPPSPVDTHAPIAHPSSTPPTLGSAPSKPSSLDPGPTTSSPTSTSDTPEPTVSPTPSTSTTASSDAASPVSLAATPTPSPGLRPSNTIAPTNTVDGPPVANIEEEVPQKGTIVVVDDQQGGNDISVGIIAGIAIGAGGLCLMGMISSRRFFRSDDSQGEEDSE